MTEGLDLTLLLISIAAPIGAIDVVYYHIYKFRLAQRPDSRAETRTHIVRSLTLGALVLVITLYRPTGLWFWAVAALFVLDFANNAVDAFLERDSRADLGGLPRVEYVIHIAGATFMGAVALSFVARGWSLGGLETSLAPRLVEVPAPMKMNAVAIGLGALALAAYEALAMAASARRRRT